MENLLQDKCGLRFLTKYVHHKFFSKMSKLELLVCNGEANIRH